MQWEESMDCGRTTNKTHLQRGFQYVLEMSGEFYIDIDLGLTT